MHDLPARRLTFLKHRGDVAIIRVEDLVQQERRPLLGCQPLEQDHECNREVRRELQIALGRWEGVAHQRFWKPGTLIGLAFGFQSAQPIDGPACSGCDQPGFGVLDGLVVGLMPTNIDILDDVLRFGA